MEFFRVRTHRLSILMVKKRYILGEFYCPWQVETKAFHFLPHKGIFFLFLSENYAMFILFLGRVVLSLKATERNPVKATILDE